MKKLIILFFILALAACGNEAGQIESRIIKKKQQVSKLTGQINELEAKLGELKNTADNAFRVSVAVKQLSRDTFNHYIRVKGTVKAENEAMISPETMGQIKRIHVSEGEEVRKGQLLVSLNTSVTESTIQEVKTRLELAEKVYERRKSLWEQNIGSEIQYLEAKNNKESAEASLKTLQAQLDMATIEVPFNGIIDAISMEIGELASPGVQVMHLVSLQYLKIYADVSEKYLKSIREGERVVVEFPELDGLTRNLTIFRKGKVIDMDSRTFRIELKLNNPKEIINPNLIAVININDYSNEKALVVPSIVIKQDIRGYYLFVVRNQGGRQLARKIYVEPGMSYEDRTEIKSGLNENDRVIVKGYNTVSNGVEVQIV